MQSSEIAPRAAYIHVPFCAHRCGYCNFALVAGRNDLVPKFLRAIDLELQQFESPQEVDTLYIGGGTPTQLAVTELEQLIQRLLQWHPVADGYEWTVEANPADVTKPMVNAMSAAGVNRLSIGAQSFHEPKLRLLERDHLPTDVERSVELARNAGMRVSVDLIFAAPGETFQEWEGDLQKLVNLHPDHISVYGLTFEKGTTFWSRRSRGELSDAEEDLERQMYLHAIDFLASEGYEQYEVSNFARPGCRSRHNENYWLGGGYYAAGPGAARYVSGVRETNHRSTTTYLKRVLAGESPVAEREELSTEARARERLVFSLRRLEGTDRHRFEQETGYSIDALAGRAIGGFVEAGLLADDGQRIRLTREGLLVSDALWPEII